MSPRRTFSRWGRVCGLFFALTLLALPGAVKAGPSNDPLTWQLLYGTAGHQIFDPVDRLTWCGDCIGETPTSGPNWIVNPRDSWPFFLPAPPAPAQAGCMWDSDDLFTYVSSGNVLAAGASAGITECLYAGYWWSWPFGVNITSPSPNLIVTETWQAWNGPTVTSQVPPPTYDTSVHLWRYKDCVRTAMVDSAYYVSVPNSNGGSSAPQLMTVTLTNPTSQKVGKTGGELALGQIAAYHDIGCTNGFRTP
jgi:hypothetical protein